VGQGTPDVLTEFVNAYDQATFENALKRALNEAVCFSRDCIDVVKNRASEAFGSFGDLAERLFEKTPPLTVQIRTISLL
jgi:hypothetical protein